MSDTMLATIVTAIAGIAIAACTGILSYRTARWNARKDMEVELRRQRLDAFKRLWALSEPLAKYGRTGPETSVTPASMEMLSRDLRHWYFSEGGMFLSDSSRDAYFHFQDASLELSFRALPRVRRIRSSTRKRARRSERKAVYFAHPSGLHLEASRRCDPRRGPEGARHAVEPRVVGDLVLASGLRAPRREDHWLFSTDPSRNP